MGGGSVEERSPGADKGERNTRIEAIAAEAFAVLGTGRQVAPFSSHYEGFDMREAYAIAARVLGLRAARGERAVGRKIGFTNPDVQRAYGVSAPIWNYMFDKTVHDFAAMGGELALAGLPEPLIEPEIALQLAAAPQAGMSDEEIFACVDWVAHGCEIVQSIFPGWKVAAADSVAGYGLHGAYFIGEKRMIDNRAAWAHALMSFTIDLSGPGVTRQGRATNVLGGPIKALRHLVEVLASSPDSAPLKAGEIVTTGTLTEAMPVAPGELWSTTLHGVELPGLKVRFV